MEKLKSAIVFFKLCQLHAVHPLLSQKYDRTDYDHALLKSKTLRSFPPIYTRPNTVVSYHSYVFSLVPLLLVYILQGKEKMTSSFVYLLCLTSLSLIRNRPAQTADPTDGFVSLPLEQSNFVIGKPYNVPEDQRYSFIDGVHKLWVYKTDKPHSRTSRTNPRTEIRIHRGPVIVPNIDDRWFRLNVIYYVDARMVKLFIDGVLKKPVEEDTRIFSSVECMHRVLASSNVPELLKQIQ
ncbi:hypothetical protein RJ639_019298 [Escallonia herrerae]|uniref:Uncharacterized protein n=1 Tax=Escallonia herrerae TaxID=1293975 RepID=A0AA88VEB3_9ASTE|nr:hypothetical protein RJ639_019298 [Escallonia herrerae]